MLDVMGTFVFMVPIIYFLPLAIKSGENLIQIASLSAYIKVFYEYRTSVGDCDMELFNWETSNNLISNVNVDRGKASKYMKQYNGEYTYLALSSLSFFIVRAIFSVIELYNIYNFSWKFIVLISIMYFSLLIVSILRCWEIHKVSNVKETMMKSTNELISQYLDRAVELKYISQDKRETAFTFLNPKKSID